MNELSIEQGRYVFLQASNRLPRLLIWFANCYKNIILKSTYCPTAIIRQLIGMVVNFQNYEINLTKAGCKALKEKENEQSFLQIT